MNPSHPHTQTTDVTTPTPEQRQTPPAEGALRHALSNGITAFLFAATGPLAILITVGRSGGLSPATGADGQTARREVRLAVREKDTAFPHTARVGRFF